MRKEKIITINDRGNELKFRIQEMPATKLESWLLRAGLLLAGSGAFDGADVPDTTAAISKAGSILSQRGISAFAKIDVEKVQPLLDDLLSCCTRIDSNMQQQLTPEIVDAIIQDVKTLFTLRKEALILNCGFFMPEKESDTPSENQSKEQFQPRISVLSNQQS